MGGAMEGRNPDQPHAIVEEKPVRGATIEEQVRDEIEQFYLDCRELNFWILQERDWLEHHLRAGGVEAARARFYMLMRKREAAAEGIFGSRKLRSWESVGVGTTCVLREPLLKETSASDPPVPLAHPKHPSTFSSFKFGRYFEAMVAGSAGWVANRKGATMSRPGFVVGFFCGAVLSLLVAYFLGNRYQFRPQTARAEAFKSDSWTGRAWTMQQIADDETKPEGPYHWEWVEVR
jgi:hypothetical protein